jgi:hypothetical protein
MLRSKRISVAWSLAGYLLATAAVPALHDHSAHAHHGLACVEANGEHADEGTNDGGLNGHDGQHRHSQVPAPCDDSCFACRLLAVKCVAPATLVVVESVGMVCLVEETPRPFCPAERLSLPLSRGPPA